MKETLLWIWEKVVPYKKDELLILAPYLAFSQTEHNYLNEFQVALPANSSFPVHISPSKKASKKNWKQERARTEMSEKKKNSVNRTV